MLRVDRLDAFYGKKQVLFAIDMMLPERRIANDCCVLVISLERQRRAALSWPCTSPADIQTGGKANGLTAP